MTENCPIPEVFWQWNQLTRANKSVRIKALGPNIAGLQSWPYLPARWLWESYLTSVVDPVIPLLETDSADTMTIGRVLAVCRALFWALSMWSLMTILRGNTVVILRRLRPREEDLHKVEWVSTLRGRQHGAWLTGWPLGPDFLSSTPSFAVN